MLSNKTYDTGKWIASIALPAFATFYITLGQTWGFPAVNETVTTIVAVNTLLGALLGISTRRYDPSENMLYDGAMIVNKTDPDKDFYTLELNSDVESIDGKDYITFKVLNQNG